MSYSIHQYGTGTLVNDPSQINDDEYVVFNEYVADSFDELPVEGPKIGDRAIFVEDGKIAIAMYFSNGWIKG